MLIFFKDVFVIQVVTRLKVFFPGISDNGALNEALWIVQGDCMFSQDLVSWERITGPVSVNYMPLMALDAQDVYGESNHTVFYKILIVSFQMGQSVWLLGGWYSQRKIKSQRGWPQN